MPLKLIRLYLHSLRGGIRQRAKPFHEVQGEGCLSEIEQSLKEILFKGNHIEMEQTDYLAPTQD